MNKNTEQRERLGLNVIPVSSYEANTTNCFSLKPTGRTCVVCKHNYSQLPERLQATATQCVHVCKSVCVRGADSEQGSV